MAGENEQVETEQIQTENQAPEDAQPEAEEAAPEAAKPEGEDATKTDPETGETTDSEQQSAEEKSRRAGGWRRKIEKLERRNEVLMQQLSATKPQQPAAPEKPKDPASEVEQYVASLVEQRLQAERAREQQERAQADFLRRRQEVRATHPDFDDVLDDVAHIPVPVAIQQVLLTSEMGPALMYSLAKNPAELARISALPPLEAAREIGRLEAKASVTPAPKAPTKTATRPPAPPTSVNGSASNTRSLDELSIADYKRAYRSGRR